MNTMARYVTPAEICESLCGVDEQEASFHGVQKTKNCEVSSYCLVHRFVTMMGIQSELSGVIHAPCYLVHDLSSFALSLDKFSLTDSFASLSAASIRYTLSSIDSLHF